MVFNSVIIIFQQKYNFLDINMIKVAVKENGERWEIGLLLYCSKLEITLSAHNVTVVNGITIHTMV